MINSSSSDDHPVLIPIPIPIPIQNQSKKQSSSSNSSSSNNSPLNSPLNSNSNSSIKSHSDQSDHSDLPNPSNLSKNNDPLFTLTHLKSEILIKLISIRLDYLLNLSDLNSSQSQSIKSKFQAQSKPTIGINAYITRLLTISRMPIDGILLGLIYLDRLTSLNQINHTHHDQVEKIPLTSLTIHRLLLSTMFVGTKFSCDHLIATGRISHAGGVGRKELDDLERETLKKLKFKLYCKTDEINQLAHDLLNWKKWKNSNQNLTQNHSNLIIQSKSSLNHSIKPCLKIMSQINSNPINPSESTSPITTTTTTITTTTPTTTTTAITTPLTSLPSRSTNTPKGIVFVKSQLIGNLNLSSSQSIHRHRPWIKTSASMFEFDKLISHSLTSEQMKRSSSNSSTNSFNPSTSSSTLVVTKLEHNQLKICHSKVYSPSIYN